MQPTMKFLREKEYFASLFAFHGVYLCILFSQTMYTQTPGPQPNHSQQPQT